MKTDFKWYALRWLLGIAFLVDGVLMTLSLGFLDQAFSLKVMMWFMNHSDRINDLEP